MDVIVLSLPSAKDRRAYMSQVLSKEGISFRFFDSLSPGDIDPKLIEGRPRYFSPEGVATFETHRKAIEYTRDRGEYVLILEDDATPERPDVMSEIDRLLEQDMEFDMLFLGYLGTLGVKSTENPSFVKIKDFVGFHSYLVNPKSVDKILALLGEPKEHVDKVISKLIREGKIDALFSSTCLFRQAKKKFSSQIPKKIDILRNERQQGISNRVQ
jgi:GR25 family glycosyltransferase involved in LPS biosynthesis